MIEFNSAIESTASHRGSLHIEASARMDLPQKGALHGKKVQKTSYCYCGSERHIAGIRVSGFAATHLCSAIPQRSRSIQPGAVGRGSGG